MKSNSLYGHAQVGYQRGDITAMDELIRSGVDVNQTDKDGHTMLIFAASRRRSEISIDVINKLIRAGVDVNQTDKYGMNSLMYATMQGHSDVVDVLIKANADVNIIVLTVRLRSHMLVVRHSIVISQ